jgi:hypothetical protein
MGSELQSIFFAKSLTFLSSVSPCIVSMKNEFSPVVLWRELSQCRKDIIAILPGVKSAPLRKCHGQGKYQWIPCNVFVKSRWELPLTEIVGDRGVSGRIGAEHSNKFIAYGLGRESLHREKQAD